MINIQGNDNIAAINKLRKGILFLFLSALLMAIPYISIIGFVLLIIALLNLISVSKLFGQLNNVLSKIGLALFFISIILSLIYVFYDYTTISSIQSGLMSGSITNLEPIVNASVPLIFLDGVALVITLSMYLFLTYGIARSSFRNVLLIVYVITSLLTFYVIYVIISGIDSLYFLPITMSSVNTFSGYVNDAYYLTFMVSIIWAVAILMLRSKLKTYYPIPVYNQYAMNTQVPQPVQQNVYPQPYQAQQPPTDIQGNVYSQVPQPNQNQQQVPPIQNTQGMKKGERLLVNLPGAFLYKMDGQKFSTIVISGSVIITDKHFIFVSKGRRATIATGLFGGPLIGLVSKTATEVNLADLQNELTEPGSFVLDLSSINSIRAEPSSLVSAGKLYITSTQPVSLTGLGKTGYNILFTFIGKGSLGGTDLKKDVADYINTTIGQMISRNSTNIQQNISPGVSTGNQFSAGQIICPVCGTPNTPDSKFCAKCGARLK